MNEAVVAAIVGAFYATFLLICLVHQLPVAWARNLANWDHMGLLPNWRFFAPKPISADYHLIVRFVDSQSQKRRCLEITDVLPTNSSWLSCVWNPRKRAQFGFTDSLIDLVKQAKKSSIEDLVDTLPYRTIMKYAHAHVREKGMEQIQFIIIASDGYLQKNVPVVVFVSEVFGFTSD